MVAVKRSMSDRVASGVLKGERLPTVRAGPPPPELELAAGAVSARAATTDCAELRPRSASEVG